MKHEVLNIFNNLFKEFPALETCKASVESAYDILKECYDNGGKVLICGNGGSASDSEHIVGELMKGFLLKRKIPGSAVDKISACFPGDYKYLADHLQGALPAISLVSQTAVSSAFINDVAADMVFAQQVYGYGKPGDVLWGLSTSGNSKNVVNAIKISRAFGIKALGMTGETGGYMKELCDACICVPSYETYRIQEYHLPVYHALCAMLEAEYFNG